MALDTGGYGAFKVKGRQWKAHRFAWTVAIGPIPPDMCVLHHCDNPICVRPDHLFLGTYVDNNHDRHAKNRDALGERNANAKFSDDVVLKVREMAQNGVDVSTVAKMVGMSPQHAKGIVIGDRRKLPTNLR